MAAIAACAQPSPFATWYNISQQCPDGPAEDGQQAANGTGGAAAGAGGVQQRMADFVLPACDSKALCAYLGLFR